MHMQTFDMSRVDVAHRIAEWNRVQRVAHGAVSLRTTRPDFDAWFHSRKVGNIQFSHIKSDPSHVTSGRRGRHHTPRGGWYVLLNSKSDAEIEIGKRARIFLKNSMIWLPADKVFELEYNQVSVSSVLYLPHIPASFDPRPLVGEVLDLDAHPLFRAAIETLQNSACEERELSPRFNQILSSMIELCLEENGADQRQMTHAQWIAVLTDFVDRNLTGEAISLETVASHFGVSTRLVTKILDHEGHSFTSFTIARRIAKARRMLIDERHIPITEVAYSAGFNDLSYFCRRFKTEVGVSARDFRNAAKAGEVVAVEQSPR